MTSACQRLETSSRESIVQSPCLPETQCMVSKGALADPIHRTVQVATQSTADIITGATTILLLTVTWETRQSLTVDHAFDLAFWDKQEFSKQQPEKGGSEIPSRQRPARKQQHGLLKVYDASKDSNQHNSYFALPLPYEEER